jgi:ABC-type dipeptide/oligopeptide/nickel transport system permease subunit
LTRNRLAVGSLVFICLLILVAIFASVLAPYHFAEGSLEDNYALPGSKFLVGAHCMGRDILSRTLYGARISISVAIVASLVSLLVGLTIGVISGYVGGRVDNIIMLPVHRFRHLDAGLLQGRLQAGRGGGIRRGDP